MTKQKTVSLVGPINADILVIGNYQGNWRNDFEWQEPADISFCVAGSSGYTLLDFQKLGNRTRIFSSIGGDGFGTGLLAQMKQAGVDTKLVTVHAGQKTAIGVYWLMHGNKKRPLAYHMSEFAPWPETWDEATENELLDADLLHCGGYLHYPAVFFGRTAELFQKAKQRGLVTSIDTQFPLLPDRTRSPWRLNMTDILPYVDVLIADENEIRSFAGMEDADQAAKSALLPETKAVVVKFGARGSRVYTHGGVFKQEVVDVGETVDTIGAGDAYGAAFMTYYIDGKPIEQCAKFASAAAGFTVTKAGGTAGMPDRREVEDFIAAYAI